MVGLTFFPRQRKRLLHDVEVCEKDGGQESGATSLPAVLVEFLAKYMDKRKKTKKSHSCLDSKKKTSLRQKKWGNIWIDTEVYFKDLTLSDVETLFQLSTFLTPGWMEYLSIPSVGDAVVRNNLHSAETAVPSSGEDMFIGRATDSADCRSCDEKVSIEVTSDNVPFTCVSGDEIVSVGVAGDSYTATRMSDDEMVSFGFPNDSVAATCRSGNEIVSSVVLSDSVIATRGSDEEMDVDDGKVIKTENEQETGIDVYLEEEKYSSPHLSPRPSVSVEWVLGSKNKIILASERPSKKRELLGESAGLEILIVSQPCEGNPYLRHFCSQGNFDSEQSNRLIICSTCGVSVHKKCYGVEENDNVESTWLCSWCKHTNNSEEVAASDPSGDRKHCFLCPKQGGALKPLETKDAGNPGSVKSGHMFCSQWMQEVYVEDTKLMEPMVNVDGINETRRKLVCSICKGLAELFSSYMCERSKP